MKRFENEARARRFSVNGLSDEAVIEEAVRLAKRAAEWDSQARELWTQLNALPRKPNAQRRAKGEGGVMPLRSGFRARHKMGGKLLYGPSRPTREQAEADLLKVRYDAVHAQVARIRDFYAEDALEIWRRRDLIPLYRRRAQLAREMASPFFAPTNRGTTRQEAM